MYFSGAIHNHIIRHDDFANRIHGNMSAAGIFDGIHMAVDGRFHIGIFKGQVGSLHGAVHQLQIFTIAQRLGADDVAVNEGQIFGEPRQVLALDGVHRVMLDNFNVENTRKAVEMVGGRIEVESSGGITFDTIRSYAECGVDYVSVGALTHSVKSLDMSFKAC